ncbi:MAG: winged helix-turn-helix domain-containing protein [Gammaproteobacteria bacterium]
MDENEHEAQRFLIGDLVLDTGKHEVSRDGDVLDLPGLSYQLIVVLAQAAPNVVSHDELVRRIWPGKVISPETITQRIKLVRQAIGDDAQQPRYIGLVRGQGYRMLAEVESLQAGRNTGKQHLSLGRIAIVLSGLALAWFAFDRLVPSPESEALDSSAANAFDYSIAILPFINSSGDTANDYLSGGLSDELRDDVSQLPGVRVMARSSSIQFQDQNLDARTIADRLNVSRVVEGRFNRQGDQLFLSVQLIDATTGFQLWSQQYERASGDLLVMQQDLTRDLASHLAPDFQLAQASRTPSAQQVSAHDLILLGRQYEQQVTAQQLVDETRLRTAIDYYRQAVVQDPQSAEAYARLGKMLLYQGDVGGAEASIFKALDLDPRLSEAHATLGTYYWLTRQAGVGAAYRRAIELNPNNADALFYYAGWAWLQGDAEQAANHYRLARDVDPLSLVRHAELGYMLAFEGPREEVQSIVKRILELFPNAPGYLAAARIAEAYGAPDEAIAYALKAQLLKPDDPDIAGQLAESHARINDFDSASMFEPEPGIGQLFWQRRYAELIDLAEELMIDHPGDPDLPFFLAFALNTEGRLEESLRILNMAGMPNTVLNESRRAIELHYLPTLIGALQGTGDENQARELAEWKLEFNRRMARGRAAGTWTASLSDACMLSALGDDDEALEQLESLPDMNTIAWLPWLMDHTCFQKFVDEPRYQAVVTAIEARLAAIRERLPQTLAKQGLLQGLSDQK